MAELGFEPRSVSKAHALGWFHGLLKSGWCSTVVGCSVLLRASECFAPSGESQTYANLNSNPVSFQDLPGLKVPHHSKQIKMYPHPTLNMLLWLENIFFQEFFLNLLLKLFDAKKQLFYRFVVISRQLSGICATWEKSSQQMAFEWNEVLMNAEFNNEWGWHKAVNV